MRSKRTRHSGILALLLVLGGLFAAFATSALAGTTPVYCLGFLPAQYSCDGVDAHSGTLTPYITTDHTGCTALAVGYVGYNSAPTTSNTVAIACTSGAGSAGTPVYVGSSYYHGAVWNVLNKTTTDNISSAYMAF
jgi:hypothetical protein